MSKHVLIFDSGLGGTTILSEVYRRHPEYCYTYVMDNACFPYGDKADDFLEVRITQLFKRILSERQPDIVIIACNTASTLILEHLRNTFHIPFIGVVPAIKPAAKLSKTGHIALLATEATVQRQYIDRLYDDHAQHCQLHRFGSPDLAILAEKSMLEGEVFVDQLSLSLRAFYEPIKQHNIDTVILGCTHFPALKKELAQCWPEIDFWVDSSQAIANRVESLLHDSISTNCKPESQLITTTTTLTRQILPYIKRFGINTVQNIEFL